MLFRLALAAAALLGLTSAATTLKNCASGTSVFTMNSASLVPANPAAGDVVDLHLDYTVPEGTTVTGGTAQYDVTLNFIPFAPSTEPLCQDVPCPLGPGTYSNVTQSMWPTGVSGTLVSKMTWKDEGEKVLLCLQINTALEDNSTTPLLRGGRV